jgi:hypothetical protein
MNILRNLYFRDPLSTPIDQEDPSPCLGPAQAGAVVSTSAHLSPMDMGDFARRVVPSERWDGMQEHLNSGCAECMNGINFWRRVMQFAKTEKLYEPPASALRIVQSYLNPLRMAASMPDGIQIAKLTFDSFQRLGIADLRGAVNAVSRQLLYKCGTVCIDIRLEPKPGSNYIVLVGQLIDAKTQINSTQDIHVSLIGPGNTLCETTTNQFGEFYFGFQSAQHMQLFLGMKKRALVIPLPETRTEAA